MKYKGKLKERSGKAKGKPKESRRTTKGTLKESYRKAKGKPNEIKHKSRDIQRRPEMTQMSRSSYRFTDIAGVPR